MNAISHLFHGKMSQESFKMLAAMRWARISFGIQLYFMDFYASKQVYTIFFKSKIHTKLKFAASA